MVEAPPNKTKMIKLRVSPEDEASWIVAARQDDMSLSDWIRRRCNGRPATAPIIATPAARTRKARRTRRKGAK